MPSPTLPISRLLRRLFLSVFTLLPLSFVSACGPSSVDVTGSAATDSDDVSDATFLSGTITLTATAVSSSEIDLRWNDIRGEESYRIERSLLSSSGFSELPFHPAANETSYRDSGLQARTTYYYRVRGYKRKGSRNDYTRYSNIASATTFPADLTPTPTPTPAPTPAAPGSFSAQTVSANQIDLSWLDLSTNESGFKLERCQGSLTTCASPPVNFSLIATLASNTLRYADAGLEPSTMYFYRLYAFNAAGNSSAIIASAATLDPPITAPAAPSNLRTTSILFNQVALAWNDNSSNESGFKIERCLASSCSYAQIGTTGAGIASYTDPSVSASTSYNYKVRAYNSAGESAYSNVLNVTTPPRPNQPPIANAGPDVNATAGVPVTLNGSASYDPDPDGSIVGYSWSFGDGTPNGSGAIVRHIYANAGTYTARLTVTDNSGAQASDDAIVTVMTLPAPSGLAATAISDTQIDLTWSESGPATWYRVERAAAPSGPWNILSEAVWAQYYSDRGLSPATTYFYQVRVVTMSGAGPASNVASATTSSGGPAVWAQRMGGERDFDVASGASLAVDRIGNVVVAGSFSGTIDFGPGCGTRTMGRESAFVAKYGSGGNCLWVARSGGTAAYLGRAQGVAVDSNGDVAITGVFEGTISLGSRSLTAAGSGDIFIAKLSGASGEFVWAYGFGGSGYQGALGIAIDDVAASIDGDGIGNLIVTGAIRNTVDFGCPAGPLVSSGDSNAFLVKFSPSGACLWARRLGSSTRSGGTSLALDDTGSIILGGVFQGTVDFGTGTVFFSAGGWDIFLAKYSAAGSLQWAKQFGSASDEVVCGVAVGPDRSIVITGYFSGVVDFMGEPGSEPNVNFGGADVFLAKYTSSGTGVWSKQFGLSYNWGSLLSSGVSIDLDGNVILTGRILDSVDLGGGHLWYTGGWDIFVAKFWPSGRHAWSKRYGGNWTDWGRAVATDFNRNIFMTGYFSESVNFGTRTMNAPHNTSNGFLVKFRP